MVFGTIGMALEGTELNQKLTQILSRLDPVALLQASWVSHIPFWLNILFIVLLAKFAASFTWLLFTPQTEYNVIVSKPLQQNQSKARLNTVSRLHLFGMAQGNSTTNKVNITKTKLRLALKGVFASANPLQSFAIIAQSVNAPGRTFKVGERLPSGAVLHEVRASEVILSRNGRLESLELPRKILNNIPIANSSSSRSSNSRTVKTMPSTNRLKKLRSTFNKSPQKFMEKARLEPVINRDDGSTEGFTFNHNDPAVMQSIGLLPTDVITAINGVLISSDPNAAYEQLKSSTTNGTTLSIDFMRKGSPQTVNVRM